MAVTAHFMRSIDGDGGYCGAVSRASPVAAPRAGPSLHGASGTVGIGITKPPQNL
jgi:hypothetical protein